MKKLFSRGLQAGFIIVALSLLALSCQKNGYKPNSSTTTGQTGLNIFLTDDPSLSFDQVWIDIQKVEVKAEDSLEAEQESQDESGHDSGDRNGDTGGGWMSLDIHPGVYDTLKFRNGLDTLFATGAFSSTRSLKKFRLTLGSNNSVVFNGNSFPLVIKGKNNIVVIKLDDDIVLGDPGQIDFSLDFDAGRSIRLHGNEFELNPQVKPFSKKKAGSIEGAVLPAQAQAVIMAISGTDTSTAKPEREGEFKIVGLKAGSYSLLFHATAGSYQDTTISNVTVAGKEDTHIGTIILHP
jgi:hypothetical protein